MVGPCERERGLGWDSWADFGSSGSYAESQVHLACLFLPRPSQTWSFLGSLLACLLL